MKNKYINFRILPAIFITMILGTISMYLVFYENHFQDFPYFLYIVLFITLVLILLLLIFKYRFLKFILDHMYTIFTLMLFLVISLGSSYVLFDRYDSLESYYDIDVYARVDRVRDYDDYTVLTLSKVKINDGVDIRENILYTMTSDVGVVVGDYVRVHGDMKVTKMYTDTLNIYNFINNTPYKMYESSSILVTHGDKYIDEYIHEVVRLKLKDNLTPSSYGIAYGVLFGISDEIDSDIYDMFSLSGLVHIIAVSGLNISVLVVVINYILNKFKLKGSISFVILSVILIFYTFLCGFSASIVRATIMGLVLALGNILGREYDIINSLSIAGIIYLLFCPLGVLTLGFQLSYLCVFAIVTLVPYLDKVLKLTRLPKWLYTSLSLSVASNLVIFPICANAFTQVSMVGIIANIVVIPLFNVAYIVLFIVTILSMIPILEILLIIPNILIDMVIKLAGLFSNINVLILDVFCVPMVVMLFMILALLILKYLMVGIKLKSALVMTLAIIITGLLSGGFVPKNYTDSLLIDYQYNSDVSIVSIEDKLVLVGIDVDKATLRDITKSRKITNIDYVIAYDYTKDMDISYLRDFGVSKVYVFSDGDKPISYGYMIETLKDGGSITDTFRVSRLFGNNDTVVGLSITLKDTNILHYKSNVSKSDYILSLDSVSMDYDYTICYSLNHDVRDYVDIDLGKIIYSGKIDASYKDAIDISKKYSVDIGI